MAQSRIKTMLCTVDSTLKAHPRGTACISLQQRHILVREMLLFPTPLLLPEDANLDVAELHYALIMPSVYECMSFTTPKIIM